MILLAIGGARLQPPRGELTTESTVVCATNSYFGRGVDIPVVSLNDSLGSQEPLEVGSKKVEKKAISSSSSSWLRFSIGTRSLGRVEGEACEDLPGPPNERGDSCSDSVLLLVPNDSPTVSPSTSIFFPFPFDYGLE